MGTSDLASFFTALHDHGIHDTTSLNVDITGGDLSVRCYDRALNARIRAALTDEHAIHGWEPHQAGRWHGTLAGVVVRLILIDTRKDVAA